MRFRKLRIAWSVFWGLACVLLVALWVRSYFGWKQIKCPVPFTHGLVVDSLHGDVRLSVLWKAHETVIHQWSIESVPMHYDGRLGNALDGPFQLLLSDAGSLVILLPYWFLLLLGILSTGMPWLPWWSKQFTLRTLLIATTLVAVVLGLIVWLSR